MRFLRSLLHLRRDARGSMAIETALVAPTLIMMTLGIFEAGTIIARQHEIQSAANEGEIIAVATNQGAETDVTQLKQIIGHSLGLAEADLTINQRYRCGTASTLVSSASSCSEDDVISTYVNIVIRETYTPTWVAFGIGRSMDLTVRRTVQIS